MRTREANRTKRYVEEQVALGESDPEGDRNGAHHDGGAAKSLKKRQRQAKQTDENFEDVAAVEESSEGDVPSDADAEDEERVSDNDASVVGSDDGASHKVEITKLPGRGRRKNRPPRQAALTAYNHTTSYLDIEPFVVDPHMPRGYAGAFDRHIRGVNLAQVWYGPSGRDVDIALRLLERWIDWPLLPPKESATEKREGAWIPDVFERETRFASEWKKRLDGDKSQRTRTSTLDPEKAVEYQVRSGAMPTLMGPHDAQKEFKFEAGDSSVLSQYGIPLEEDEAEDKAPRSCVIDSGGLVLSLDWARSPSPNSPQYLALATVPYKDQENYSYEEEAAKSGYQKHGTVQIWELYGEKDDDDGYTRPAPRKPQLLRTICLDSGRAKCVKWSPADFHLAILCGNGSVNIVEPLKPAGMGYRKLSLDPQLAA